MKISFTLILLLKVRFCTMYANHKFWSTISSIWNFISNRYVYAFFYTLFYISCEL